MAEIQKTKLIKAGDWRTLEWGWNARFSCRFFLPAGARVKVRYGGGWPFGTDSQEQKLDGINPKVVNVGGGSIVSARVQILVQHDVEVRYAYIATGP